MESVIHGVVGLTVTAIVFAQVLLPTLVTTNTTAWNSSAASLWGTSQIISVVGFIVLLLGVFGI